MVISPRPVISQAGFLQVFNHLSRHSSHAILLDGGGESPALNRWAMMGMGPRQVLSLKGDCLHQNGSKIQIQNESDLFSRLREAFDGCSTWDAPLSLPFYGGWMGYFGYEFHRWCDSALAGFQPALPSAFPDMLLCEFQDWLILDKLTGEYHLLSDSTDFRAEVHDCWQSVDSLALDADQPSLTPDWERYQCSFSQPDFESSVETICNHIVQGDLYQANLSFQLQQQLQFPPADLYQTLCQRNPSPFSGIFRWPEGMILCNSPERLVQMDASGLLQSRPIAGTRGRGKTPEEDEAIGQSLLENEKERAEHLMLVDLQRNDLGRVCVPGTVAVDELLVLERYSHVTHLVSNVRGQKAPDKDVFDILKALFPGGTITGCPKIRCIQILNALEPVARGPYTGSLGYLDRATGALDLNILIRSLFLSPPEGGQVSPALAAPFMYNTAIHAGAGIVADSVGAHEYRECLRKASAIVGVLSRYELSPP